MKKQTINPAFIILPILAAIICLAIYMSKTGQLTMYSY